MAEVAVADDFALDVLCDFARTLGAPRTCSLLPLSALTHKTSDKGVGRSHPSSFAGLARRGTQHAQARPEKLCKALTPVGCSLLSHKTAV